MLLAESTRLLSLSLFPGRAGENMKSKGIEKPLGLSSFTVHISIRSSGNYSHLDLISSEIPTEKNIFSSIFSHAKLYFQLQCGMRVQAG